MSGVRPAEFTVARSMTCPVCRRTIRLSSTGTPYSHRGAGNSAPRCPYPGRRR